MDVIGMKEFFRKADICVPSHKFCLAAEKGRSTMYLSSSPPPPPWQDIDTDG